MHHSSTHNFTRPQLPIMSRSNVKMGFQGQLQDDEIIGEGNSVNYTYRMHDPRLGRFFAVDPLTAKYPANSPFAFSENRVIDMVELEGLEAILPSQTTDNNILKVYDSEDITKVTFYNQNKYVSVYWEPSSYGKKSYTATNFNNAARITDMAMAIDYDREDPFAFIPLEPDRMVKGRNRKSLVGTFELNIMKGKGISSDRSQEYGKAFRHLLIQGLITDVYGKDEAKDFGDAFEQGSEGVFNKTTNDGRESYGDLINNALGRESYSEWSSQKGNTLSNINGFTNYLNFVAQQALNSDSDGQKGKYITFKSSDESVQNLYKQYQFAKQSEESW